MHSPWFRLWLYRQCGKGPVSVLLPQGTSFSRLSGWVGENRIYRVEPWRQEAVPVQVEGLLPYLLDALPETPVMLQACDAAEWPVEDVAFPFLEGCWDPFGDDKEGVEAMAAKLAESVDMEHTCGFLRLVQVKGSWLPQDLSMGIPGHSRKVNAQVLRAVTEKGLMTGESLQKAMEAAGRLRESLGAFVAEMQGVGEGEVVICRIAGQSAETAPEYPARAITFDGQTVVVGGVSDNNRRRPL